MNRFFKVMCLLVVATGLAFANGQGEAQTEPSNVVQVTMEGYAGDFGTIDQIEAKLQAAIDEGNLSASDLAGTKWKLGYLETLASVLKEKGYEFNGLDWGWAEQLTQKEMNAFLAKTGPDVIVGETQMPGFAFNKYLMPFPADLAERVRATVAPGAYGPMEVDGEIYGIATYPGVNVLFWNKDLLRKAGLDPDHAPATWDEWLSMCQKITAAGNGEFYGGGTYAGPNFGGSLRVGPFLMMAGGGFIDSTGHAAFDSAGNIKALTFMRELAKNSPAGAAAGAAEGGWWDAFNQQKIAYVVDGPWRIAEGRSVGIDIGYSVLPIPAGGKAANVTIGAAFYGVPTYTSNPDGAFAFIEALLDRRVQDQVVVDGKRPPVLKAYASDPKFMASEIAPFFDALQGDVSGLPTFMGKQNAKIWDVFHQAMTESIITNGNIADILGRAQALAERYENE